MKNNIRTLLKGLNESIADNSTQSLPITLAKVTSINQSGTVISATLYIQNLGLAPYTEIPLIKNKYVNTPIQVGDTVLLLTLSHLLETLLETQTITDVVYLNSYVAIPFALTADLANVTNNFMLKNPEETITGEITANNASLIGSTSDLEIGFNAINIKGNSIRLGNDSETIKTLLEELIDILLSSSTEIGGGGDAPHTHKTIDSGSSVELNNLKNKIASIFT